MNKDTLRGIWRSILNMPFDEVRKFVHLTRKADAVMAEERNAKRQRDARARAKKHTK